MREGPLKLPHCADDYVSLQSVSSEAETVASELDARLHTSEWDPQPAVTPATGVADFALAAQALAPP